MTRHGGEANEEFLKVRHFVFWHFEFPRFLGGYPSPHLVAYFMGLVVGKLGGRVPSIMMSHLRA